MVRLNGLIIEKSNPLSEARARLKNKLSPFRRGNLARTGDILHSAIGRLGSKASSTIIENAPVAPRDTVMSTCYCF